MNLTEASKYKWYSILGLDSEDDQLKSRFYKLGIVPGIKIKLKRRAPFFRDPLLFQVEESQVILTKKEAAAVLIQDLG